MRLGIDARHLCAVLGLVLLVAAAGVNAGPLDREPGQRQNPAAENMLRVPGVVGLYEDEAMAALQQAGLGVQVKRIAEDDPRYRSREGRVVRQVPGAGGVAMVGSTVVITVYKEAPQEREGTDYPWGEVDTGGWIPPASEEVEPGHEAEPGYEVEPGYEEQQ